MSFDLQLAGARALPAAGAVSVPPWSRHLWNRMRESSLSRARFRAAVSRTCTTLPQISRLQKAHTTLRTRCVSTSAVACGFL